MNQFCLIDLFTRTPQAPRKVLERVCREGSGLSLDNQLAPSLSLFGFWAFVDAPLLKWPMLTRIRNLFALSVPELGRPSVPSR